MVWLGRWARDGPLGGVGVASSAHLVTRQPHVGAGTRNTSLQMIAFVNNKDMFTEIGGVPAHPLFVHVPVVLIPLASITLLVWAIVPRLARALAGVTTVMAVVAAVSVLTARSSGEALMELFGFSEAAPGPVATHAQWANYTTVAASVLAVVALAMFWLYWRERRAAATVTSSRSGDRGAASASTHAAGGVLGIAVHGCAVIAAIVATYVVVQTGHQGAVLTWQQ